MLDAVTFDYWNTLLWEEPGGLQDGRVAAWLGVLEEAGVPATLADLDAAHESAFQSAARAWEEGTQYTAEHAGRHVLDRLGVDAPDDVAQAVVEVFSTSGSRTVLHETEGLRDVLEALTGQGVRVGIICDVGLTPSPVLREHLQRRDLLRYFSAWAFSDELGVYKPDPQPFRQVLAELGVVDPARAAHTGDRLRTDVAGARGAGLVPVRYTAVFDDPSPLPEADHVVASHHQMLTALGLDSADAR